MLCRLPSQPIPSFNLLPVESVCFKLLCDVSVIRDLISHANQVTLARTSSFSLHLERVHVAYKVVLSGILGEVQFWPDAYINLRGNEALVTREFVHSTHC